MDVGTRAGFEAAAGARGGGGRVGGDVEYVRRTLVTIISFILSTIHERGERVGIGVDCSTFTQEVLDSDRRESGEVA